MCADSEDDFMGAIKIKDGLFIGDEFSAQVSTDIYLKLFALKYPKTSWLFFQILRT